jgi:glycerol uptake facilitator-like aquaporin
MTLPEAVRYWIAQLAGAFVAGLICLALFNHDVVVSGTPQLGQITLASQVDAAGKAAPTPVPVSFGSGVVVEAILTFFLVFVVMGTGVDPRGPKIGGLAIGLTVALDILFGGPLTGAAMNPARTFGPALAANFWKDHAVYWIGPMLGGAAAGFLYGRLLFAPPKPGA